MKTAVEWLVEQIKNNDYNTIEEFELTVDQAKEMEKEQVTLSHINGQSEFDKGAISENTIKLATEYYNQTFKSEE